MTQTQNEYIITPCHGYFTIYHRGNFVCTADSYKEAELDIKSIEQEKEILQ